MSQYERVCARVDLDAIVSNMRVMKERIAKETKMIAVIKTDGYGHGAIPIAKRLEKEEYVLGFATATAEEALILRKAEVTKTILVLGYTFPESYEEMIENEISFTVFRLDMLDLLSKAAKKVGKKAKVHVKVDTGMNRIGICPNEDGMHFVHETLRTENISFDGIFTHLFSADFEDKREAKQQVEQFKQFVKRIEEETGYRVPIQHCSNSAGLMGIPEGNMDVVRAGVTLYGLTADGSEEMGDFKPALSLQSQIVYLKEVEAGCKISYGGTFITKRKTKVATIPVGYGDGYPRALSNKGYVLIRGQKAPILGRVCMDQFMVDVTDIADVCYEDKVTLIGKDNGEIISVEHLCSLYDGFNYEFVCDLNKRIPREYYEKGVLISTKDYNDDIR